MSPFFPLFVAWYNFCHPHMTRKTTPAVAAGLAMRSWSGEGLLPRSEVHHRMIENSTGNERPKQAVAPAVICVGGVLAINAALLCAQANARFDWDAMAAAVWISPVLNCVLSFVCVVLAPVIRRSAGPGASLVAYVATAVALPLLFIAFQVALFAGFWVRGNRGAGSMPNGVDPVPVSERLERLEYFGRVALEDLPRRLIALHTLPTVALLAGTAGCLLIAALLIRRYRSGRSTSIA
jgi:hypothetical protein